MTNLAPAIVPLRDAEGCIIHWAVVVTGDIPEGTTTGGEALLLLRRETQGASPVSILPPGSVTRAVKLDVIVGTPGDAKQGSVFLKPSSPHDDINLAGSHFHFQLEADGSVTVTRTGNSDAKLIATAIFF